MPGTLAAGDHGLSMKLWIGVTDNDWFRFLRSLSGVEEVNFWLFLVKLHYTNP